MNGFGRIGVPAIAMALASLLLHAQAAEPLPPLATNLPPIHLNLSPGATPLEPDSAPLSADALLPIVSQGFASDHRIDGSIEPLVQALHSDSYPVREQASHDLMCLPPNRLQDLTAALAVETDEEAISRLQAAAGHLYLKPRTNVRANAGFLSVGADATYISMLGMKFDDPEKVNAAKGQEAVGVRVRELQPGFPAAQELQNGDVITAIAGRGFPEEMVPELVSTEDLAGDDTFIATSTNDSRRLAANSMFQARIRALMPGSIVTFTVLRDSKITDIPVQMAAMKSTDGIGLSSLVDLRNKYMADFVASLKTGDSGPSPAHAMSVRADTPWDRR